MFLFHLSDLLSLVVNWVGLGFFVGWVIFILILILILLFNMIIFFLISLSILFIVVLLIIKLISFFMNNGSAVSTQLGLDPNGLLFSH